MEINPSNQYSKQKLNLTGTYLLYRTCHHVLGADILLKNDDDLIIGQSFNFRLNQLPLSSLPMHLKQCGCETFFLPVVSLPLFGQAVVETVFF